MVNVIKQEVRMEESLRKRLEFINSLDLRNMYGHGTHPFGDENVHYSNYIRFLKLFILIIIKINDELCIKDDLKK